MTLDFFGQILILRLALVWSFSVRMAYRVHGKEKHARAVQPHARDKIARLDHLGINESTVISIVLDPEKVEPGYLKRKVAQRVLGRNLVLRVVFEEMNNTLLVITVYPASGRRY